MTYRPGEWEVLPVENDEEKDQETLRTTRPSQHRFDEEQPVRLVHCVAGAGQRQGCDDRREKRKGVDFTRGAHIVEPRRKVCVPGSCVEDVTL